VENNENPKGSTVIVAAAIPVVLQLNQAFADVVIIQIETI